MSRQRQRFHGMKGSRRGYYADIDDFPACSGEDDAIDAANTMSSSQICFYSHVRPRRREKKNKPGTRRINKRAAHHRLSTSNTHPDIDLSLVSLLTSNEYDRRFGLHPFASPLPTSSESNDNSSSSESRPGQVNDNIIKKGKKHNSLASSCPFAVIDYGSVELDMSGSLLDSIYKIGGRGSSSGLLFGGRRLSLNDASTSNSKKYDNKAAGGSQTRIIKQGFAANAAALLNSSYSVASSRSSEVEAVIASLKNVSSSKRNLPSYSMESQEHKKRKNARDPSARRVENLPITLENAISFSPFARVLICAKAPHNVVHINAAYSELVQQGRAKPYIVGESLSPNSNEHCEVQSPKEYIAKIIEDHIVSLRLKDKDNRNCKSNSEKQRISQLGFVGFHRVHILPVMSTDETCSYSAHGYEKCHLLHRPFGNVADNVTASVSGRSKVDPALSFKDASQNSQSCNQYISHYLLQIEH